MDIPSPAETTRRQLAWVDRGQPALSWEDPPDLGDEKLGSEATAGALVQAMRFMHHAVQYQMHLTSRDPVEVDSGTVPLVQALAYAKRMHVRLHAIDDPTLKETVDVAKIMVHAFMGHMGFWVGWERWDLDRPFALASGWTSVVGKDVTGTLAPTMSVRNSEVKLDEPKGTLDAAAWNGPAGVDVSSTMERVRTALGTNVTRKLGRKLFAVGYAEGIRQLRTHRASLDDGAMALLTFQIGLGVLLRCLTRLFHMETMVIVQDDYRTMLRKTVHERQRWKHDPGRGALVGLENKLPGWARTQAEMARTLLGETQGLDLDEAKDLGKTKGLDDARGPDLDAAQGLGDPDEPLRRLRDQILDRYMNHEPTWVDRLGIVFSNKGRVYAAAAVALEDSRSARLAAFWPTATSIPMFLFVSVLSDTRHLTTSTAALSKSLTEAVQQTKGYSARWANDKVSPVPIKLPRGLNREEQVCLLFMHFVRSSHSYHQFDDRVPMTTILAMAFHMEPTEVWEVGILPVRLLAGMVAFLTSVEYAVLFAWVMCREVIRHDPQMPHVDPMDLIRALPDRDLPWDDLFVGQAVLEHELLEPMRGKVVPALLALFRRCLRRVVPDHVVPTAAVSLPVVLPFRCGRLRRYSRHFLDPLHGGRTVTLDPLVDLVGSPCWSTARYKGKSYDREYQDELKKSLVGAVARPVVYDADLPSRPLGPRILLETWFPVVIVPEETETKGITTDAKDTVSEAGTVSDAENDEFFDAREEEDENKVPVQAAPKPEFVPTTASRSKDSGRVVPTALAKAKEEEKRPPPPAPTMADLPVDENDYDESGDVSEESPGGDNANPQVDQDNEEEEDTEEAGGDDQGQDGEGDEEDKEEVKGGPIEKRNNPTTEALEQKRRAAREEAEKEAKANTLAAQERDEGKQAVFHPDAQEDENDDDGKEPLRPEEIVDTNRVKLGGMVTERAKYEPDEDAVVAAPFVGEQYDLEDAMVVGIPWVRSVAQGGDPDGPDEKVEELNAKFNGPDRIVDETDTRTNRFMQIGSSDNFLLTFQSLLEMVGVPTNGPTETVLRRLTSPGADHAPRMTWGEVASQVDVQAEFLHRDVRALGAEFESIGFHLREREYGLNPDESKRELVDWIRGQDLLCPPLDHMKRTFRFAYFDEHLFNEAVAVLSVPSADVKDDVLITTARCTVACVLNTLYHLHQWFFVLDAVALAVWIKKTEPLEGFYQNTNIILRERQARMQLVFDSAVRLVGAAGIPMITPVERPDDFVNRVTGLVQGALGGAVARGGDRWLRPLAWGLVSSFSKMVSFGIIDKRTSIALLQEDFAEAWGEFVAVNPEAASGQKGYNTLCRLTVARGLVVGYFSLQCAYRVMVNRLFRLEEALTNGIASLKNNDRGKLRKHAIYTQCVKFFERLQLWSRHVEKLDKALLSRFKWVSVGGQVGLIDVPCVRDQHARLSVLAARAYDVVMGPLRISTGYKFIVNKDGSQSVEPDDIQTTKKIRGLVVRLQKQIIECRELAEADDEKERLDALQAEDGVRVDVDAAKQQEFFEYYNYLRWQSIGFEGPFVFPSERKERTKVVEMFSRPRNDWDPEYVDMFLKAFRESQGAPGEGPDAAGVDEDDLDWNNVTDVVRKQAIELMVKVETDDAEKEMVEAERRAKEAGRDIDNETVIKDITRFHYHQNDQRTILHEGDGSDAMQELKGASQLILDRKRVRTDDPSKLLEGVARTLEMGCRLLDLIPGVFSSEILSYYAYQASQGRLVPLSLGWIVTHRFNIIEAHVFFLFVALAEIRKMHQASARFDDLRAMLLNVVRKGVRQAPAEESAEQSIRRLYAELTAPSPGDEKEAKEGKVGDVKVDPATPDPAVLALCVGIHRATELGKSNKAVGCMTERSKSARLYALYEIFSVYCTLAPVYTQGQGAVPTPILCLADELHQNVYPVKQHDYGFADTIVTRIQDNLQVLLRQYINTDAAIRPFLNARLPTGVILWASEETFVGAGATRGKDLSTLDKVQVVDIPGFVHPVVDNSKYMQPRGPLPTHATSHMFGDLDDGKGSAVPIVVVPPVVVPLVPPVGIRPGVPPLLPTHPLPIHPLPPRDPSARHGPTVLSHVPTPEYPDRPFFHAPSIPGHEGSTTGPSRSLPHGGTEGVPSRGTGSLSLGRDPDGTTTGRRLRRISSRIPDRAVDPRPIRDIELFGYPVRAKFDPDQEPAFEDVCIASGTATFLELWNRTWENLSPYGMEQAEHMVPSLTYHAHLLRRALAIPDAGGSSSRDLTDTLEACIAYDLGAKRYSTLNLSDVDDILSMVLYLGAVLGQRDPYVRQVRTAVVEHVLPRLGIFLSSGSAVATLDPKGSESKHRQKWNQFVQGHKQAARFVGRTLLALALFGWWIDQQAVYDFVKRMCPAGSPFWKTLREQGAVVLVQLLRDAPALGTLSSMALAPLNRGMSSPGASAVLSVRSSGPPSDATTHRLSRNSLSAGDDEDDL